MNDDVPFPEVKEQLPFPDAPVAAAPAQEQSVPFPEAEGHDQTLAHPVETHKTGALDFGNNVGRDAWEDFKHTVGGIMMAPIHGIKSIWDTGKAAIQNEKLRDTHPDQYTAPTLSDVGKAYQDHAAQMGDAMVDSWAKWYKPDHWEPDPDNPGHYKKVQGSIPGMIARKFYHEPTSAVLDTMTAVDLGGGVVGGLGKVSGIGKLEALGDTIRAAPAAVVKKGWDKARGLMGQDAAAKDLYLSIADEELSGVQPKANADINAVLKPFRELTPEERTLAHEISLNGLTDEEAAALRDTNPKVMEAADTYRDDVQNVREKGLKKFNLEDFNDDVLENRLAKQYAKQRYGKVDLTPDELEAMRQEMKTLQRKPVYVPSREELQSGLSLEDALTARDLTAKKVGFLERYTKGRLAEDPMEYVPRVANSFRKTEGDLRLIKRVLQEPSLVSSAEAGNEAALANKLPTTGILKKYINSEQTAKAIYLNELVNGFMKKGLSAVDAEATATRLISEDAGVQKRMEAIKEIVANPTVRKLLGQEFYRAGGVARKVLDLYDNINTLVKMGATRLNPRYYAGVATGQALMSLLSGTLPKWGRRARELVDFLPTQVQHVALEGGLGRKLLNAADVHGEMQAATKSGMLTRFAARRIGRASELGFNTTAKINEVLPDVLQSTRNLGDFQVMRQQLHERMIAKAGEMMGLDEQLAALPKRNTRQIARLQAERNLLAGDLEMKAIDSGALSAQIPEFQKYADLLRPAVREANAYLGSSNALTPIEKGVWRRLVPYYTFNKTISTLAFRLPFIAPTSAFLWSRMSAELNRMTRDPELGDRMRGFYPMYLRENGDTVWVSLEGMSHAGGLGLSHIGGIPVPNMLNPVRANHFLSLGFKLLGGKTEMDIRTVPFGTDEMFVNGHNGEVIRLDENGKPIAEITQLPLIKGVAHVFPWVQYAEHVLQPYQQTTEGWLLNPQAIKKPDGTYKYPYELMQSLPQMLGPKVTIANRDQLIYQKKMHEAGIIREIKKAIPSAGPEQREMLIQGLRDYTNGLRQN